MSRSTFNKLKIPKNPCFFVFCKQCWKITVKVEMRGRKIEMRGRHNGFVVCVTLDLDRACFH